MVGFWILTRLAIGCRSVFWCLFANVCVKMSLLLVLSSLVEVYRLRKVSVWENWSLSFCQLMVLALDSFRFSFIALSEWCWFIIFSESEGFPFSLNWLLLKELVRFWLSGLDIISHFRIPWVVVGFQFLDSSIVFVFNLMKIIILGTSVVGSETKGKLLVLGFGCHFSCGRKHDAASGIGPGKGFRL